MREGHKSLGAVREKTRLGPSLISSGESVIKRKQHAFHECTLQSGASYRSQGFEGNVPKHYIQNLVTDRTSHSVCMYVKT